ncbi:hypothetical protein CSC82_21235, partial [Rhodobacteraceae bacterium 4F10]
PSASFAELSSTQRNRQRASLVFPQRNGTVSELRWSFLNATEPSASFAELSSTQRNYQRVTLSFP